MSKYTKTEPITSTDRLESLPLLLIVRQAAEVGGWSEKHVRDQLAKGHIRGCKLGQSWRVNRDEFLQQVGLVAANG